jgi:hypothetical protein
MLHIQDISQTKDMEYGYMILYYGGSGEHLGDGHLKVCKA